MDGIFILNQQSNIAKISQPNSILSLLASCGQVDVMLQEIGPDCPTFISPGEDKELMEFFYIIEGCLSIALEEGERQLGQNDCFYVSNLQKSVYIKSGTGAKLLYVSNKPIFNYLYSYLGDLSELLRITDLKDTYTYGHGKRVMEYSVLIGERLTLDKHTLRQLTGAALFHDVGKCYIPDQILRKPSELTPEEFWYIRSHPIHSRTLIENKLGKDIGEIAEQHHERLDGKGYPYGLKEPDIRLEARIIAVADTFDAITTDRPYRRAKTFGQAVGMLLESRGTALDTEIVNAFSEIFYEGRLGPENIVR